RNETNEHVAAQVVGVLKFFTSRNPKRLHALTGSLFAESKPTLGNTVLVPLSIEGSPDPSLPFRCRSTPTLGGAGTEQVRNLIPKSRSRRLRPSGHCRHGNPKCVHNHGR